MSYVDSKQELSWAYQAADMDATDPITDGTKKNWYWGLNTAPSEMPAEDHEFIPIYYSNRDPTELVLLKSKVQNTIGFLPTTAIAWYQFLGASSTDASHIHTITGKNTGNIETICARQESYGSVNKYWVALDNKVQTLTFTQDLRNKGNPAAMAIGLLGVNSQTAAHNDHYAPKYPTDSGLMAGTELKKPYLFNTSTSLIWDYGADNVEYIDALLTFTYQGTNAFQPHYIQDQHELEFIFEGNRSHRISFEIRMGKNSSIFDDFEAGTLHDLRYKVYNTSTYYQQLDISGIGLSKPRPSFDLDRDKRVYVCEGMAKSITVTSLDGITDYPNGAAVFYGESS